MWEASTFFRNDWRSAQNEQLDGRPPRLDDVLEVAERLLKEADTKAPLATIRDLAERSPIPGADGIAHWGRNAAGEFRDSVEDSFNIAFDQGALWIESGGTNPRAVVAWQDNTAIVVAFPAQTEELELGYDDSQHDETIAKNARSWLSEKKFGQFSIEENTFLEWRFYTGTDSGIFDGVIGFAKKSGQRVVRIAAHGGGLLVGTVVRILSTGSHRLENDPLWTWNLHRLEGSHPNAAKKFPRLKGGSLTDTPICTVIVHGTFSCGIRIAREIEHIKPCVPIYRYEHDTFKQISENGRELAGLIRSLKCPQVLLVTHSRGGLVACVAAIDLRLQNVPIEVKIWTYGTPHDGTPLVEAGSKTLGWLYRLGADLVKGVVVPPPLQWAMSYFLGTVSLPPGIEAMAPGCGFLGTHQGQVDYLNIEPFGGTIDPTVTKKTVSGQAFTRGLVKTMFGGKLNDLVVPYDSAIWPNRHGSNSAISDCAHMHFFKQQAIQNRIASYGCPDVRDDISIEMTEDEVIIGGTRVPISGRRK